MTNRTEFHIWGSMLQRCLNPKNSAFANYGGRGIHVCERWRTFENFYADMGQRPSSAHSIDRLNNDGDYEPGNVAWRTAREQGRNRRTNHWIEYDGVRLVVSDWAPRVGLPETTLRGRLALGVSEPILLFASERTFHAVRVAQRKLANLDAKEQVIRSALSPAARALLAG